MVCSTNLRCGLYQHAFQSRGPIPFQPNSTGRTHSCGPVILQILGEIVVSELLQLNTVNFRSGSMSFFLIDASYQRFIPNDSFRFPKRSFGKPPNIKQRSCSISLFQENDWLHYDQANDAVFCHICVSAIKRSMVFICTFQLHFNVQVFALHCLSYHTHWQISCIYAYEKA